MTKLEKTKKNGMNKEFEAECGRGRRGRRRRATHLQVVDDLAHGAAEVPRFRHVPDDGRRQTDGDDEEVGDGEVHDEVVRHRPHAVVPPHGEAHEPVADQPGEEDDGVGPDEEPLGRPREHVGEDHVDVFVIRDAIVVRTLHRRLAPVTWRRLG